MTPDRLRPLFEHPEVTEILRPPIRRLLLSAVPPADRLGVLMFGRDDSAPSLFAKVSSDPETRVALRREYRALCDVGLVLKGDSSVPAPIALVEQLDWTGFVQSTLPGTSMEVSLSRGRRLAPHHGRNVRPVLEWLDRFQAAARGDSRAPVDSDDLRSRVLDLLPTTLSSRLSRAVVGRGEQLGERAVGTVTSHGDLWPGNVLVHRGAAAVVDWEESSADHLPTDDLIMFLSTYAFMVRRGRRHADDQVAGFRDAWLGSGRVARLCTGALLSFGRARGLDAKDLDVLIVQFLVDRCVHPVGPTADEWRQMLRAYAEGSPAILDAPAVAR